MNRKKIKIVKKTLNLLLQVNQKINGFHGYNDIIIKYINE